MFDYLEKFRALPENIRNKVSNKDIMIAIEELEKKYNVDLAAIVMKVVVGDIKFHSLGLHLSSMFKLEKEVVDELVGELKEKVFFGLKDYLGIKDEEKENESIISGFEDDLEGLVLPELEMEDIKEDGEELELEEGDKKSKADFFFSADDEEEIRKLSKKVAKYDKNDNTDEIENKVIRVIDELNINLGSELLNNRLKKILATYIKGIRDRIDTKQTLTKSIEDGGLNFDEDVVYRIMVICEDYIKEIKEQEKKEVEDILKKEDDRRNEKFNIDTIGARDVDYDLSSMLKKGNKIDASNELAPPAPVVVEKQKEDKKENEKVKEDVPQKEEEKINEKQQEIEKKEKEKEAKNENIVGNLDLEHELAPPAPVVIEKQEEKEEKKNKPPKNENIVGNLDLEHELAPPAPTVKKEKQDSENKKIKDAFLKNNSKTRKNLEISGKKRMDDVKYVPKTRNPIDELRYLNLVTFRRLSNDPMEIVGKIEEKINLLEQESYGKRIKAIKAWRQSMVNKLYLEIGQESISKNKTIEEIIDSRKGDESKYLSQEEFDAIMNLNKRIRY